MKIWYRITLLGTPIIFATVFSLVIGSFAMAVEPEQFASNAPLEFFLMGMVMITPIWLISFIPARYNLTIQVFSIIAMIESFFLLLISFSSFGSILNKFIAGLPFSEFAFLITFTLMCVFSVCIYVLFKIHDVSARSKKE